MGDKPKRGDTVFPVHHQRHVHTGRITNVARKWMTVEIPYVVKMPISAFNEVRPGHWEPAPRLDYNQRHKALAEYGKKEHRPSAYTCRYCDHGYTGTDYYAHRAVEIHLANNHPEEFLDLLGGGDG